MDFKVGDRVKAIKDAYGKAITDKTGTIIHLNDETSVLVEFDENIGGHDGLITYLKGKNGHCWWVAEEVIKLVDSTPPIPEPTPEPTPAPIQVNITIINNYDNACWYCRKGGMVDRYFNGRPGICPSCGRACNSVAQMTKSHKPTKPVKKENKPLTLKELEALPDQTKIFIVWAYDGKTDARGEAKWNSSGWGVIDHHQYSEKYAIWKVKDRKAHQPIKDADRCFYAYLEEPERPAPEIEIPF